MKLFIFLKDDFIRLIIFLKDYNSLIKSKNNLEVNKWLDFVEK
jgi:hypothetical protein